MKVRTLLEKKLDAPIAATRSSLPGNEISGYASRCTATASPERNATVSAWFTRARTCMEFGSITCMNGTPARTSSPSCTSPIWLPFQMVLSTTTPGMGATMLIFLALLSACSMALRARSRWISRMRSSERRARCFRSKVSFSCARRARASSMFCWFFSASMRETTSLRCSSSSADFNVSSAWWSSVSSFARATVCSACFFLICSSRSRNSVERSSAVLICVWRSNSTSRSPGFTGLPGRASLVMMRVPKPPPVSCGAATM